jgi:hypothetical protein
VPIHGGLALMLLCCCVEGDKTAKMPTGPTLFDSTAFESIAIGQDEIGAADRYRLGDEPDLVLRVPRNDTVSGYIGDALVLERGGIALIVHRGRQRSRTIYAYDGTNRQLILRPLPRDGNGREFMVDEFYAYGDSVLFIGDWPGIEQADTRQAWVDPLTAEPHAVATFPEEWGPSVGVFDDGALLITSDPIYTPGVSWLLRAAFTVSRADWPDRPEEAKQSRSILVHGFPYDQATGLDYLWGHNAFETMVVSSDKVWIAPTWKPELLALSQDGDPVLRIVWETADRSISTGTLAGWQREQTSSLPDSLAPERRQGRLRDILNRRVATHYPAVAAIEISAGRIHVRPMELMPVPRPSREWLLFSESGELLGRIDMPDGLRVLAFQRDRVLVTPDTANHVLLRYPVINGSADGAVR